MLPAIPRPVIPVAVRLPVLPSESPVSSTFSVSLPPSPLTVSTAAMALTSPPVFGARLPTFTVSASAPVLTVVAAEIARTFTVSASAPPLTVNRPAVDSIVIVSPPASPSTIVVPACVLTTVTVSTPSPAPTASD